MSLFFLCTAVFLAAIFLWRYLTKRNKLSKSRRLLLCAAAVFLLLILLALAWVFDCYPAGPEAVKCLVSDENVRVERMEKGWRFDGPGDRALIFYPGAKVEAAAYAPLMRALAAGGLDAFLVEMPLRFAILDKNAADRIIGSYEAAEWLLAGHSLGGVAAAACAGEHPETLGGLVFLASYPADKVPDEIRALSIRCDRDGVMNRKRYEESRVYFPAETEEIVLHGANHAQFGDYGPQSGDNEAQITAAQQQAQTAEAILNWIRAIPHNSARADPEKIWVLIKALFRRCTLCTSRKSDEIRAQIFQEMPKADCAVLP